jgi:hypothetical protein
VGPLCNQYLRRLTLSARLPRRPSHYRVPSRPASRLRPTQLPTPLAHVDTNSLLAAELRYESTEELRLRDDMNAQLNLNQRSCFDAIVTAIEADPPNAHFFLPSPASTGKTLLSRCLCHYYRSQSKVIIVNACLQRSFLWPSVHIQSLQLNMRVRSGDRNQHFVEWVHSLAHDTAQASPVIIPAGINQCRTMEPFYRHLYPPALLARAYFGQYAFRDRAILTDRNDTVTEINDDTLNWLICSATDFYSVNTVEANNADTDGSQDPPPAELLQPLIPPVYPCRSSV